MARVTSLPLGDCERACIYAGWPVVEAFVKRPGYLVIDEPDLPLTVVIVVPCWCRAETRDYMIASVFVQMRFEQSGMEGVVQRLRATERTFRPREQAAD